MTSAYRQISLQTLDVRGVPGTDGPSLSDLRLGLMMLFCGMMLTLGVTLSLAAHISPRDSGRPGVTIDAPVGTKADGTLVVIPTPGR